MTDHLEAGAFPEIYYLGQIVVQCSPAKSAGFSRPPSPAVYGSLQEGSANDNAPQTSPLTRGQNNIASALFPSLQQLILVGDHQQLPPSCDIARLAKDPYNLNISLFERLVDNNLPYTILDRQRRMAPELRCIVQKFYPKLKDHPLVKDLSKRPLIPGLGDRRSWFFTHQWPEDIDADNSKFNQAEVEMVVSFVRYLLHNGVDASEITILTYYKGQKRRLLHRLRQIYPTGKFFNVATVDSYQGEENEIVILSLVRSPGPSRDYRVGFLDNRNRATVAISRARRGFFMFGNKENLLNATIDSFVTWAPIWNAFAEQHRVAISKGLPLVCQNHGNEIWVKDADGLVGNAGGCWKECECQLQCGQACGRTCHITSHDVMSCSQPCTKALEYGHKCAKDCGDSCQCSMNCPEYAQIRLRIQLAQAQKQAELRTSDTHTSRATRSTLTHSSTALADWQNMVQDPASYDRNLRSQIMRDVRLMEETFKTAFEGIKETYISVSDQHGRRVQGATKQMEIREDTRLSQQMTRKTKHLDGSGSWQKGTSFLWIRSSDGGFPNSSTRGGFRGRGGFTNNPASVNNEAAWRKATGEGGAEPLSV